jgi:pyruvate dehydrogenase E2 component (dihydrolipoamide acetyltransferase)
MAETIKMPKLGFDMVEGTLVRWVKKVGEVINKREILAEIETDKATVEVESPASGTVRVLLVEEGAVIPVNTPIAVVGTPEEVVDAPAQSGTKVTKVESVPAPAPLPLVLPGQAVELPTVVREGKQKVSPLAKRIALEKKVDLTRLMGSGPGGRIVRRDIEAAFASVTSTSPSASPISPTTVVQSSQIPASDQVDKFSRLRQAISRRMTDAKTTIPHFYVTHEYNMDALMDLRSQLNRIVPETEKVSVNDFMVKSVALALRQFPRLNSSIADNGMLVHSQVNIGVAVSVEGGLLTVVCREADKKSLQQIAGEVRTMVARARENKVRPEEIEGSTFSISNLGMFDVENFAAIINPPESAILAVGTVREIPLVSGGIVKPGLRLKATLSVDHRLSDGAEAAKFMQALAVFLEEPLQLIL